MATIRAVTEQSERCNAGACRRGCPLDLTAAVFEGDAGRLDRAGDESRPEADTIESRVWLVRRFAGSRTSIPGVRRPRSARRGSVRIRRWCARSGTEHTTPLQFAAEDRNGFDESDVSLTVGPAVGGHCRAHRTRRHPNGWLCRRTVCRTRRPGNPSQANFGF